MDDWSGSGIEDGRNATPKSLSRCSPDLFSEKISQFSDFDIESFCEASNHTSALGTEEDARHSGLTNAFSDGDPIASGANTDWLTSQRESSLKTQRSGSRSSARNKSSKKGPESVKWSQDFPDDHESVDHDVRASLNRDKTQAPPLPNFSFLKNGSLQSSANSPSPQKVTSLFHSSGTGKQPSVKRLGRFSYPRSKSNASTLSSDSVLDVNLDLIKPPALSKDLKQEKQPLVTDSRAANSESESLMSVVVDLLKPCPDSMNDETIMSVATVNTGASDATAFLPCTQKGVTREDSQSLGSIDIPLQDDCIPAVKTAADVMGPSSFNSPLLELSPSFRALADELDDPKARPSETQIRQVEEELDRIADADLPGMSGWSSFPDLPSQTAGTVQESSEIIYGTMDDSRCESQLQKKHFTTDDVINATLTESQKICTDAADVSNQEVCMQSPPPSSKPVLFTSTLKRKAARSRNVSESSSSSSESSVSTSSSEVEFLKSSDVSGLAFGSTPAKSSAQIPHEKGYDDLKASNDLTASDEDEIAGVISRKSKMAMLPDVDLTKSYCKELLGLPAFEVASGSEECSGTPGNSLSNSKKSFIRKRFRNRVIESESEDECEHVDRDTKFKSGSSKSTQVKRSRSERVQNENIPKLRTKQHRKASKNKPVKTSVKKSVESKTVEPILSAPASEQYKKISQQNQKNISREALAPKADSSKIMGLFRDISRNKACDINADLSHLLKDESTTPDRGLMKTNQLASNGVGNPFDQSDLVSDTIQQNCNASNIVAKSLMKSDASPRRSPRITTLNSKTKNLQSTDVCTAATKEQNTKSKMSVKLGKMVPSPLKAISTNNSCAGLPIASTKRSKRKHQKFSDERLVIDATLPPSQSNSTEHVQSLLQFLKDPASALQPPNPLRLLLPDNNAKHEQQINDQSETFQEQSLIVETLNELDRLSVPNGMGGKAPSAGYEKDQIEVSEQSFKNSSADSLTLDTSQCNQFAMTSPNISKEITTDKKKSGFKTPPADEAMAESVISSPLTRSKKNKLDTKQSNQGCKARKSDSSFHSVITEYCKDLNDTKSEQVTLTPQGSKSKLADKHNVDSLKECISSTTSNSRGGVDKGSRHEVKKKLTNAQVAVRKLDSEQLATSTVNDVGEQTPSTKPKRRCRGAKASHSTGKDIPIVATMLDHPSFLELMGNSSPKFSSSQALSTSESASISAKAAATFEKIAEDNTEAVSPMTKARRSPRINSKRKSSEPHAFEEVASRRKASKMETSEEKSISSDDGPQHSSRKKLRKKEPIWLTKYTVSRHKNQKTADGQDTGLPTPAEAVCNLFTKSYSRRRVNREEVISNLDAMTTSSLDPELVKTASTSPPKDTSVFDFIPSQPSPVKSKKCGNKRKPANTNVFGETKGKREPRKNTKKALIQKKMLLKQLNADWGIDQLSEKVKVIDEISETGDGNSEPPMSQTTALRNLIDEIDCSTTLTIESEVPKKRCRFRTLSARKKAMRSLTSTNGDQNASPETSTEFSEKSGHELGVSVHEVTGERDESTLSSSKNTQRISKASMSYASKVANEGTEVKTRDQLETRSERLRRVKENLDYDSTVVPNRQPVANLSAVKIEIGADCLSPSSIRVEAKLTPSLNDKTKELKSNHSTTKKPKDHAATITDHAKPESRELARIGSPTLSSNAAEGNIDLKLRSTRSSRRGPQSKRTETKYENCAQNSEPSNMSTRVTKSPTSISNVTPRIRSRRTPDGKENYRQIDRKAKGAKATGTSLAGKTTSQSDVRSFSGVAKSPGATSQDTCTGLSPPIKRGRRTRVIIADSDSQVSNTIQSPAMDTTLSPLVQSRRRAKKPLISSASETSIASTKTSKVQKFSNDEKNTNKVAKNSTTSPRGLIKAPIIKEFGRPTRNTQIGEKLVFTHTSLSKEQKKCVENCAKILDADVVPNYSSAVTHVITSVDGDLCCPRTLKYMLALLEGKWILSIEWVTLCLEETNRVPESIFEVRGSSTAPKSAASSRSREAFTRGEPALLSGCEFYLAGDFKPPSPPRDQLCQLIKVGGAKLLNRLPREGSSVGAYHAPKGGRLSKCGTIILSTKHDSIKIPSATSVSPSWLLDCIAQYQLVDSAGS